MSEPIGVQAGQLCPGCGREDFVPLIWGLPSVADVELADRGDLALGGCLVAEPLPTLVCRSCGLHWGTDDDAGTGR